jgi:hypothetical protein
MAGYVGVVYLENRVRRSVMVSAAQLDVVEPVVAGVTILVMHLEPIRPAADDADPITRSHLGLEGAPVPA